MPGITQKTLRPTCLQQQWGLNSIPTS
jgi:hypothetical protein